MFKIRGIRSNALVRSPEVLGNRFYDGTTRHQRYGRKGKLKWKWTKVSLGQPSRANLPIVEPATRKHAPICAGIIFTSFGACDVKNWHLSLRISDLDGGVCSGHVVVYGEVSLGTMSDRIESAETRFEQAKLIWQTDKDRLLAVIQCSNQPEKKTSTYSMVNPRQDLSKAVLVITGHRHTDVLSCSQQA